MKLKITILASILAFAFTTNAQSKMREQAVGLYLSPGMFNVKDPVFLNNSPTNYKAFIGGLYQIRFHRNFTYRLQIGVGYDFSIQKFPGNSQYSKTTSRSLMSEFSPVQMLYTVNPESNFQFYLGLGVAVRTQYNTLMTQHSDAGVAENWIRKKSWQVGPTFLMGLNIVTSEYFSLYLQPEYRIIPRTSSNSYVRNEFCLQLGFTYKI